MATITAKAVNELRKITGAGMMDCKKALVEADGDQEKAIDFLRKKGQKIEEKRKDREATEGAVFIESNGSEAAVIQLNCETDFVARNDDFQGLGKSIVETAFNNKPATLDALLDLEIGGRKIADLLTDNMGKIGEKLQVSSYETISAENVVTYLHMGARVGVAVGFEGAGDMDVESLGKDIAMQIAAMGPIAVDESGVSQDIIDREMAIGRERALEEGKPEAIVDRIAEGVVKKYLKEKTLLNQAFVKDSSKTIAQYLKEANPNLKVTGFKRVQLGVQ